MCLFLPNRYIVNVRNNANESRRYQLVSYKSGQILRRIKSNAMSSPDIVDIYL